MKRQNLLQKILLFALTIPIYAFIFLPIAWLVISAVSSRAELLSTPLRWLPANPNFKNFFDIITAPSEASQAAKTFRQALQNSLLVATCVTAISLFTGSLASYALVRLRFRFQRVLLIGILATRMIPEVSLVVPLYLLASQLHLLNTPYILIITYLSFALPFVIWLMSSFFETIPVELEEAARIDGASRLGILFRIVLPITQ
jgi:multiple sugar transport system permease protein